MKCKVIDMPFILQSTEGFPQIIPVGTIIGDGTEYPVPKGMQKPKAGPFRGKTIPRFIPGPNLEALDDEAREVQDKYAPKENLTLDDMPLHTGEADLKKQKATGF